ncbi:hypothetical protein [Micromonospora siamensis]|uniref:Uncharacterized protein n=1 Tax=Micromonospora siamensis TaxID=299152 RepID=A0A1C5J3C2_9ACTN|nr:hypothetical protein [Micromonospora siamensis]SCG64953.1 hypothetical protein GA0074704_4065 [Micromonospora siamensis]
MQYFVGTYGRTDHSRFEERAETKRLVKGDPQDWLAVVPLEVALRDVELIKAVIEPKTLGEVRRSPLALPLVKASFDERATMDGEPPFDELGDDVPFDWYDELDVYWRPDPRLRTAELAPPSLLATFGQEDRVYGMDYEPATWLPLDDQDAIEAALRELGHEVVHDDTILNRYLA